MAGICSIDGCGAKTAGRGLCSRHYMDARRTGSLASFPKLERAKGGTCAEQGCPRAIVSRGLCSPHWEKAKIAGVLPPPVRSGWKREPARCTVGNCTRYMKGNGMCSAHWQRYRRDGAAMEEAQIKERVLGAGCVNEYGYRMLWKPGHPFVSNANNTIPEHRLVMAEHLQRKLLPHENVHHKNGDRLDNRLENLELWSISQPPGQRIDDKVAWAIEILRTYKPEALNDEPVAIRVGPSAH